MIYKTFKDSIELSRLGMGIMRLPVKENEPGTPIDREKAQKIIDYAVSHGVNYFDTAYIYHNGESESFTGEALSKYPRESFYIADKCKMSANPDYRAQFAEQLARLQMDYIDFYLLHGIQDHSIEAYLSSGCISYFEELKKQGKIRYLGFSFHGGIDTLKRMLAAHPWDFVQLQLNYYDWMYGDAKVMYQILEEAKIPIMVMEPVHGGCLASLTPEANAMLKEAEPEKSIASWAMRWVMSLPNVYVILSGMSNKEQAVDNVKTFDENEPLTKEQWELVMKACEMYRPNVSVACTACRYCCTDCPKGLDIPRLLSIYNEVKMDGPWRLSKLKNMPPEKMPSACVECGSCHSQCPQSFAISTYIKEMADMLEQM